jgi:hypothetical protein
MARKAGGAASLEAAKACLAIAKTSAELRQSQAVVLPLACGLSLKKTDGRGLSEPSPFFCLDKWGRFNP